LRSQLGGLVENALLLQILEEQTYVGQLSGWRKGGSEGPEVDFIWRHKAMAVPLECKATQSVTMKHWSGIKAYLDASDQKIGFLISAAPFEVIRNKDRILINLPLYFASLANTQRCIETYA